MGAHRPIGAIAQTFARADLVLVGPGRATASLAGDSPRPGAVRAMQCSVGDGMLGPLPPTHARLRTPPRGRAKWVPGGQLVRSRRLLHGRIWPWPGPTVPRPRWSGISLGQEQFGPCHELLAIRCSVQCPLCLLGCVRRPVAELNGCPEVHWPYRIDFCTGGFGRGRARPCHGLVGRGFP